MFQPNSDLIANATRWPETRIIQNTQFYLYLQSWALEYRSLGRLWNTTNVLSLCHLLCLPFCCWFYRRTSQTSWYFMPFYFSPELAVNRAVHAALGITQEVFRLRKLRCQSCNQQARTQTSSTSINWVTHLREKIFANYNRRSILCMYNLLLLHQSWLTGAHMETLATINTSAWDTYPVRKPSQPLLRQCGQKCPEFRWTMETVVS